jgi:hypothetical protein
VKCPRAQPLCKFLKTPDFVALYNTVLVKRIILSLPQKSCARRFRSHLTEKLLLRVSVERSIAESLTFCISLLLLKELADVAAAAKFPLSQARKDLTVFALRTKGDICRVE